MPWRLMVAVHACIRGKWLFTRCAKGVLCQQLKNLSSAPEFGVGTTHHTCSSRVLMIPRVSLVLTIVFPENNREALHSTPC